jgi:NADH:ubiquinone reductase (non-electrogenic)
VTLIESQRILSSFDDRLQKYAEKQISQRKRFTLLRNSVIGMFFLCVKLLVFYHSCSVYRSDGKT